MLQKQRLRAIERSRGAKTLLQADVANGHLGSVPTDLDRA